MCRACRRALNCGWASAGDLGCRMGELDQMQACLMMPGSGEARRS